MIFPRAPVRCLLYSGGLLFLFLLCWINRDLLTESPWLISYGGIAAALFLFAGWRLCRPGCN